MSGSILAIARCCISKVGPVNIGPQLFATNFPGGNPLDRRAMVGREIPLPVAPEAHGLRGHLKVASHLCRTTNDFDCLSKCIHGPDSTLVELEKSTLVFFRGSTSV